MKTLIVRGILLLLAMVAFNASFFTLGLNKISAQTDKPSFILTPDSGAIIVGKEFYVDIKINSASHDLISARVALKFDPDLLQVSKAEKGEIFCNYPTDTTAKLYAIDNSTGYILITGQADGTTSCPYFNSTIKSDNLFARLYFRPLRVGTAKLEFLTATSDQEGYSAIFINGSPSVFSISNTLKSAQFSALSPTVTPTDNLPTTGFWDNTLVIGSAILLGISIVVVILFKLKFRKHD